MRQLVSDSLPHAACSPRAPLLLVSPRFKTRDRVSRVSPTQSALRSTIHAPAALHHNVIDESVVVTAADGLRTAGRLLCAAGRRRAGRGRLRRWPLWPPRSRGGRRCGRRPRGDGQAADSQQIAPDAAAGAQPDAGRPAEAAGRRRQPQRPQPEFLWGVLRENGPGHPVPRPRSVLNFLKHTFLNFIIQN